MSTYARIVLACFGFSGAISLVVLGVDPNVHRFWIIAAGILSGIAFAATGVRLITWNRKVREPPRLWGQTVVWSYRIALVLVLAAAFGWLSVDPQRGLRLIMLLTGTAVGTAFAYAVLGERSRPSKDTAANPLVAGGPPTLNPWPRTFQRVLELVALVLAMAWWMAPLSGLIDYPTMGSTVTGFSGTLAVIGLAWAGCWLWDQRVRRGSK